MPRKHDWQWLTEDGEEMLWICPDCGRDIHADHVDKNCPACGALVDQELADGKKSR